MHDNVLFEILVFVGILTAMGCVTSIAHGILKRWRTRPAELGRDVSASLNDISQRLARLEQTMDTTAVEIERISEGQRFTTKLLFERSGSQAPAAPDPSRRVITPH
jgi:hypothetical protein